MYATWQNLVHLEIFLPAIIYLWSLQSPPSPLYFFFPICFPTPSLAPSFFHFVCFSRGQWLFIFGVWGNLLLFGFSLFLNIFLFRLFINYVVSLGSFWWCYYNTCGSNLDLRHSKYINYSKLASMFKRIKTQWVWILTFCSSNFFFLMNGFEPPLVSFLLFSGLRKWLWYRVSDETW